MSPKLKQDDIADMIKSDMALTADRSAKYLATLRYNLRRDKLGICRYGGCKAPKDGARYCRAHMDYRNKKQNARYSAKKKAEK